jgi:anti-sigma-K factor RskA
VNPSDPEDRTVAAAEFVLGTLSDREREDFRVLMASDPALQAEVGFWQDRLLGLADRIEPVEPSSDVWLRIDASLHASHTSRSAALPDPAQRAPAPKPAYSSTRWWNRVNFWRGFSALTVAASLMLASLLMLREVEVPQARYVAVLQSPDKQAGWVVHAADREPVKLVPLADPGPIPPERSWQFWTKGKDAAAPTSLGLLRSGEAVEIPRERLPELGDEQLFEITLEPEAGSPTGRPTGPILFVGTARRT